jgi:hypothetical protein
VVLVVGQNPSNSSSLSALTTRRREAQAWQDLSPPAACSAGTKSTRQIGFLQPVLFVCSGRLAVVCSLQLRVESGANRSISTAWTENTRACRHTACRSHALFVHGPHRRVKALCDMPDSS